MADETTEEELARLKELAAEINRQNDALDAGEKGKDVPVIFSNKPIIIDGEDKRNEES